MEESGHPRLLEVQRARVIAAMVEESSERGAANVTVAHIVARAGVSRRTFYELFSDREACFLGAFDDGIARASRHMLETYDPTASWIDRVRGALIGLLSFLDAERDMGRLLLVGSLGAGTGALEHRQDVLAQMVALIEQGGVESEGLEPPPLTAEGIVGGVLSVLHSRLIDATPDLDGDSSLALTGPLMSMIVLPYLGAAAARRELAKPAPEAPAAARRKGNPLGELEMRLTYRTVRVLMAIAALPGSSNRIVAEAAEVTDQGQMSKLLARLHDIGLIENTGGGAARGEPNAWTLTDKGWRVHGAIAEQA
jgi:AcrR family transcriptional regulator